jgi:hypothetical protein
LYEKFISNPGGYKNLLGQERSALTGKLIRLHPNATGYRVIAETWFEQSLENLIAPDKTNSPITAPILLLLMDDNPNP